MIKKILFPIDGSEEVKKSLDYVIELAEKFQSEVVVFYSYDIPESLTERVFGKNQSNQEIENEILFSFQNYLNKIKQVIESKGIKAKVLIGKGKAGISIIESELSEDCDLVVIGRRSLNPVKNLLIGSVTNYVVHHSKCPVLIIDLEDKEVVYENAGN